MPFRPLSRRDDPDFGEPVSGLPDYLLEPVVNWVRALCWKGDAKSFHPRVDTDRLRTLQTALQMNRPLDWSISPEHTLDTLFSRMHENRTVALDVLDFLVQRVASDAYANELGTVLTDGGSEWEIAQVTPNRKGLTKRTLGPTVELIEEIYSVSERAGQHLGTAWSKLRGREPDASAAYREAIKAVEAVARPVVSPDNPRATLGSIIRDLRTKPEKWEVVLDRSSATDVADLADRIWQGQVDRHGSDDPAVPLSVSLEQADAAVHLAIPLVRLFVGNGIRRV